MKLLCLSHDFVCVYIFKFAFRHWKMKLPARSNVTNDLFIPDSIWSKFSSHSTGLVWFSHDTHSVTTLLFSQTFLFDIFPEGWGDLI